MTLFASTEIDRKNSCKHVAIHLFEADGYRDLTSYNAFFNSLKRRNWSPSRLFVGKTKDEYDLDISSIKASFAKLGLTVAVVPEIKHESIWDFYKYIGYDFKKKKLTPEDKET